MTLVANRTRQDLSIPGKISLESSLTWHFVSGDAPTVFFTYQSLPWTPGGLAAMLHRANAEVVFPENETGYVLVLPSSNMFLSHCVFRRVFEAGSSPVSIESDTDSTIAHFFAERIFDSYPEVERIAYWRDDNQVTIWTMMTGLDRKLRRSIYEIQDETILHFTEYKFDFYVLSAAAREAIPESFTLIENPNK